MSWFEEEKKLTPEGEYNASIYDVSMSIGDFPKLTVIYKLHGMERKAFQNFKFTDNGKKWLTWQMNAIDVADRAKELAGDSTDINHIAECYYKALDEQKGGWVTLKISHRNFEGKTYESATVTGRSLTEPVAAPDFKVDQGEEIPF